MNQTEEQMNENKALMKKQRREERKQQEEVVAKKKKQQQHTKNTLLWGIPAILIVIGIWLVARSPQTANIDDPIISRSGIHWHPNLEIWIKGERVTIPANIGLGPVHSDMHTHKENDQIHLEMSRAVRESDTELGMFFDVWGKEFNSQCIIDACNSDEGVVRMFVNGEENTEFERYHMRDGDKIQIRYE